MSTMQYRYKIVENKMKLLIDTEDIKIKIEPNLIIRGTINNLMQKELTQTAQNILELNTKMDCLGPEEIIGGKIIACLDRQHPRDIFDIIRIMKLHNIKTQVFMDTIFFYLLQSNRPISELLNPNKKEISKLYENQFVGLTDLEVSLDLLLKTRDELISFMQTEFLNKYKDHIITFIQSKGELSKAYKHFSRFPGIKWKIINLNQMNMSKLHNEISIINKL